MALSMVLGVVDAGEPSHEKGENENERQRVDVDVKEVER